MIKKVLETEGYNNFLKILWMNALNCMLKIAEVIIFVMCILSDSQNST